MRYEMRVDGHMSETLTPLSTKTPMYGAPLREGGQCVAQSAVGRVKLSADKIQALAGLGLEWAQG